MNWRMWLDCSGERALKWTPMPLPRWLCMTVASVSITWLSGSAKISLKIVPTDSGVRVLM